MKVSLVVIAKNEALNLAKCLGSCVGLVDELIVVDSGSTDDTIKIAQQFNARVINNKWLGFGKQKQFGLKKSNL